MKPFFKSLEKLILCDHVEDKCNGITKLYNQHIDSPPEIDSSAAIKIERAGLPKQLKLVAPRDLKRRGIGTQEGRNVLMHSIAHIEFSAMNLAMDACYRFRGLPEKFYLDWLSVAADEARHFLLVDDYLKNHDCQYGDYPSHNGLWDMAVQTAHDPIARMALVPRVLEARGLDVTPKMIARFDSVNDLQAASILKIIYQEEIGHVDIGSTWFKYLCEREGLEPNEVFSEMVTTYFHGEIRGPFNVAARLMAGFEEKEIKFLERADAQI